MKPAPLRSFQEFAGSGARFDFPDEKKVFERVEYNLIYYQSNYFIVAVAILIILLFFRSTDMMMGLLVGCFLILGYSFLRTNPDLEFLGDQSTRIIAAVITCLLTIYSFIWILNFILFALLCILLVVTHAVLRKRPTFALVKSLVSNPDTPMQLFLKSIGYKSLIKQE